MEPFLRAEPAKEPTPRPRGPNWRRRRHRGQPVPTRATRDENLQTRRTPQQSLGELAQQQVVRRCLELLARVRDLGVLAADADLEWTRRVYYALIGESLHGEDSDADADALATRIIDTLLHGAGKSRLPA